MAWIESHTVLLRHRKVLLFASALGLKPVQAIGHLHALWHAVLEQQEDGDLSAWPDEMIAFSAAYEGDAVRFVHELQDKNWLDGRVVHDWLDYAGRYLTVKYRTANPKKLKHIFALHKSVYKSVSSRSKVRLKTDNLTRPNLSEPNQTLPEEQEAVFENEFWKPYPDRNGKKVEKAATKILFFDLSPGDRVLACKAVTHYADSLKQQGLSAKDPKRFLRDGKGLEPWRDWIEPAQPAPTSPRLPPPQVKCCWVNGGKCEEYANPGSRYCEPHGILVRKAQDRVAGRPPGGEVVSIQTGELLSEIGRSM